MLYKLQDFVIRKGIYIEIVAAIIFLTGVAFHFITTPNDNIFVVIGGLILCALYVVYYATLKETLQYFSGVLRRDFDDILPFIERLRLDKKLNTRLESFSEGQKAMTRIAVGLMNDPKVLVLDEITATLDVQRKEEIIDIIEDIDQEKDLTILMVDHDATVVDRLCNKIIILDQRGKIAKIGFLLGERAITGKIS